MTPEQTATAIARVMMLAAGPLDTDEDEGRLEIALDVFDGDEAGLRDLATVVARSTAEKLPDGAAVGLNSLADLAALSIVSDVDRIDGLVATLPAAFLPAVATSLLGMWRAACSIVAMQTLDGLRIPTHLPEGV